MTGRLLKIGIPIALLGLVVSAFATDNPEELAKKLRLRQARPQRQIETRFNVPVADGSREFSGANLQTSAVAPATVLRDSRNGNMGLRVSSASASSYFVPPIVLCAAGTSYDYQHNDDGQHQVATLGGSADNMTHFAWTFWGVIPDSLDQIDRFVNYQGYLPSAGLVDPILGLTLGDCGQTISGAGGDPQKARAGFCSIDVSTGDLARPAFHQRNQTSQDECGPPTNSCGAYGSYVEDQGIPGLGLFIDQEMPGSRNAEAIWPKIDIDQGGSTTKAPGDDVFHVVSHPTGSEGGFADEMFYWRRIGGGLWEGPAIIDVDDGVTLNGHISADPTDEDVAVIYTRDQENALGLLDVIYVESANNGADWLAVAFPTPAGPITNGGRKNVTNYAEANGPQSWLEVHGEYDNSGNLHVVFVEQLGANTTSDCRVKHWDALSGNLRTVAQAIDFTNVGGDGGRDLWLASAQVGFGDGTTTCNDGPGDKTNLNYVYVTYEQYGGEDELTEGNDVSGDGNQQNLEIYLAVSNDNGNTWSPSVNLTGTKTPGCNGTPGNECASERDPSIAKIVNDTIHIFYVLDIDAGDAVFGSGTWTFNPVHYMRIPGGTDVKPVCPTIAPNFAAFLSNQRPGCEYNAPRGGSQLEELRIQNLGNAALTGSVSVVGGAPWLSLTTGAYSINAGAPDDTRPVTMDASGITIQGLYQETIAITHNDTTKTSPKNINVDFFVFDEFACPEFVVLNTGWLWLEVGNTERFANQNDDRGGLTRLDVATGDTSWSIFDGSLVISRPMGWYTPPNPGDNDTLVYRNIFGEGPGQPGFRALSSLVVDTSAYGTNVGVATATASQTTADSTLGIDVVYSFPQETDSCEFVLIKYKIFNRDATDATDLVIGAAVDFDVIPGTEVGTQNGSQNSGHLLSNWNAVYQRGADTVNHVVVGDLTAQRYEGGMTAIMCGSATGWIAPNDPNLFEAPGGGFTDGYLFRELANPAFRLLPPNNPDPEEDLHSVIAFEQGVSLLAGGAEVDSRVYALGLVSSNTGPADDATDITNTIKKAWKYCFGWAFVTEYAEVDSAGSGSWTYHAIGSHEDGRASDCCGCVVTMSPSSDPGFSITPDPLDPCTGKINYQGVDGGCGTAATGRFIVTTAPCAGVGYSDECVVEVLEAGCSCSCPSQADMDTSGFVDSVDLGFLIDAVFFGGTDPADPGCPTSRGDFDYSGFTDSVDLGFLIDHVFFGGPPPTDPCA